MNLAFFASLIALTLIITISIRKQTKRHQEQEDAFWARENRSNSVRKKSLDGLPYIKIPLESFPTHLLNENEQVLECINILESLTSQKILNLTGYSNTDLKLEYGTANITVLTEYDQNYTVLIRTLQKWADLLIEAGYMKEAVTLMEFSVTTGSDISSTYYTLAKYYADQKQFEEIDRLQTLAKNLRSGNGKIIVKRLHNEYPAVF